MKKLLAIMTAFALGCVPAAVCAETDAAVEPGTEQGTEAETENPALLELEEYKVDDICTIRLPEGFEVETREIEGMEATMVFFQKEDLTISVSYFDEASYEAAGVPLPKDLEEYSTREGVRRGLPEDAEFAEDEYGNFCTEFDTEDEEDGSVSTTFQVLLKNEDGTAYGGYAVTCAKEDYEEMKEDFALWASSVVLA